MKLDIYDSKGKVAESVTAPELIFGKSEADIQASIPTIHQVVTAQRAAARQGTHSTKTRAEVSGGGKKPFRQKGTGRARQGTTRAPQMRGGGIVFGPKPRDYSQRVNKKIIFSSLCSVLSNRANAKKVFIVNDFGIADKPNTKTALKTLEKITNDSTLIVVNRDEQKTIKSLANPAQVHLCYEDQLNCYDVLVNDAVTFTKAAYDGFIERTKSKIKDGK
ncbi:MAG: 50S ribosomal protein L4 [Bifidobacteriaceae bacterium]|nr:50S ribosomal protein L4 [Bifidobacteriaceae bacterium]